MGLSLTEALFFQVSLLPRIPRTLHFNNNEDYDDDTAAAADEDDDDDEYNCNKVLL